MLIYAQNSLICAALVENNAFSVSRLSLFHSILMTACPLFSATALSRKWAFLLTPGVSITYCAPSTHRDRLSSRQLSEAGTELPLQYYQSTHPCARHALSIHTFVSELAFYSNRKQ